jgi:hypothetical protein
MPPPSIEQRVAALEHEVSELKAQAGNGRVKDWRRTVGRFTDNPGMKELFADAMKLREADRRKVRRPSPKKRPPAS